MTFGDICILQRGGSCGVTRQVVGKIPERGQFKVESGKQKNKNLEILQ